MRSNKMKVMMLFNARNKLYIQVVYIYVVHLQTWICVYPFIPSVPLGVLYPSYWVAFINVILPQNITHKESQSEIRLDWESWRTKTSFHKFLFFFLPFLQLRKRLPHFVHGLIDLECFVFILCTLNWCNLLKFSLCLCFFFVHMCSSTWKGLKPSRCLLLIKA